MVSLFDRFDYTSSDAGIASSNTKTYLLVEDIQKIEHCFEEYEKVSLSFLFYDDINTCYKICEKCINSPIYRFLSANSFEDYKDWDQKLLECIFYVKNFLILQKLGIGGQYDAERYFKDKNYVSKQRLLFYKICESLTNEETSEIMKSIPSLKPEKYAETYILKVLSSEGDLKFFLKSLSALNNPLIQNLLKESSEDCPNQENIDVISESKQSQAIPIKSDKMYSIKDPLNVGLCFIINEVNFKNQENREGSMKDVSMLHSTMMYFHFDVQIFSDVPKKFFEGELQMNIEKYFKANHSVFFLVILSHGIQGAVYTSDDKLVAIDFITNQLFCKTLYKIPKVMIIQACQGENTLTVDNLVTDGSNSIQCDQIKPVQYKLRRHISDFLLAMSTVPGFKAFRNQKEGTWFIQTFCKCLRENEHECMLSIITQTIKEVKDHSIATKFNFKLGQQPEMKSLLEKKLYLKPCLYN